MESLCGRGGVFSKPENTLQRPRATQPGEVGVRGVSSGRTRTRSHGRPSQTSQAVFLSPEPWRTCEPQSARAKGRVLADPARRHPRTCRAGAAPPPLPPPNPAGSVSPNLGREQRRAPPVLGSAGRGRPRVRTHTQGAAQKPQTAERPPTPVRTAPRPGTAPGGLPPRTPRPRPLGRHRHLELRVAPWDTRGVGPWTQAKQAGARADADAEPGVRTVTDRTGGDLAPA